MKRRELKPCGTSAAYRRHLRKGESTCSACRRAQADDVAVFKRRGPVAPRELTPCPSEPAYQRHKRRKEPACIGCLDAHAAYEAQRAARQRAAA